MLSLRAAQLLLVLVFSFTIASAQDELPEINIFNGTSSFCDGLLYDSGGPDDTYSGNENIVFTIESPGIIDISFFGDFCLESGFDMLTIFDGPDILSPVLGIFSGTTLPPDLGSTGNFLTFQMTTDPSASYCGFSLIWSSTVPPPIPPALSSTPQPVCGSTLLNLNFSSSLECSVVEASDFQIIAPPGVAVNTSTVLCNQGASSGVSLDLSSPFEFNCTYEILWIVSIPDACDSLHNFEVTYSFLYDQCPVQVEVIANPDTICSGSGTNLTASALGCLNYSFTWDQGLPAGSGPHMVSPSENTSYTVTATELETGLQGSATVDIVVVNAEILTPPQASCATAQPFQLLASQSGIWSGTGITDSISGWFDPSLAQSGFNEIIFAYLGCTDTLLIEVQPIDAGIPSATCPGAAIINLSGTPAGGTWTGDGVNADGTFDPVSVGIYYFFYTQGGCTDSTSLEVANISIADFPDSLCQSEPDVLLAITPMSGSWSGSGITQSDPGIFSPAEANSGNNILTYTLVGCSESWNIFVLPIEIGGNFHTACPQEEPLVWYNGTPEPPGGYWTGDGIVDADTGLFDPSLFVDNTYTYITYQAPNGCSDTMTVQVVSTYISTSTLDFCIDSEPFILNGSTTGNGPGQNGIWIGDGISFLNNEWSFDPSTVNPGSFFIYYEKNNCLDSIEINVVDPSLPPFTTSYCQNNGIISLPAMTVSGNWSGPGVIGAGPTFNTEMAAIGTNTLTWTSYNSCVDTVSIFIEEFFQSSIQIPEDTICFSSNEFSFTVFPDNGYWDGPISGTSFIPSALGEGTFQINYNYQGDLCESSDSAQITILGPITGDISVSDTMLCQGQASSIAVNAYGGNPDGAFNYLWSDESLSGAFQTIIPSQSETIFVGVSDGCSDTLWLQAHLEVLPAFQIELLLSDTMCFGADGFVEASVIDPGSYSFDWDNGAAIVPELIAPAGTFHSLVVSDDNNGCMQDTVILIPAWSPLSASFSVNPNVDCIPFDEAGAIEIIDFSNNAVSGIWILGNGNIEIYNFGENVDISYNEPGYYDITLILENEGGCTDTARTEICILPPTPIFIPDIFSPNGDGNNDELFVRSQGIVALDFRIYNRWGEEVFHASDISKGWDGRHRGLPSPEGSYAYFIKANLNDGEKFEATGEIVLIR